MLNHPKAAPQLRRTAPSHYSPFLVQRWYVPSSPPRPPLPSTSEAGTFELNLFVERYPPYENFGVIGTPLLELPTVVRRFEYDTISAVTIPLRYTACDKGSSQCVVVEQS